MNEKNLKIVDALYEVKKKDIIIDGMLFEKRRMEILLEKTGKKETADKIIEISKKIDDEIDACVDERKNMFALIKRSSITTKENKVVTDYYFHGKEFKEIAIEMGYSYSYILKLHMSAIKKMSDIL